MIFSYLASKMASRVVVMNFFVVLSTMSTAESNESRKWVHTEAVSTLG